MNPSVSIMPDASRYINGLVVDIYDSVLSDISIDVGQCRDAYDKVDIFNNSLIKINSHLSGPGGIDTGVSEGNVTYAVYIIWDSTFNHPVSGIFSRQQFPIVPSGYDSYRQVGFWKTDNTGRFSDHICGNIGTSNDRQFLFIEDNMNLLPDPLATIPTKVTLGDLLPRFLQKNNILSTFGLEFTGTTAGDSFQMGSSATTFSINMIAPANGLSVNNQANVICPYDIDQQTFWYQASLAADNIFLNLEKFYYEV